MRVKLHCRHCEHHLLTVHVVNHHKETKCTVHVHCPHCGHHNHHKVHEHLTGKALQRTH